MFKPSTFSNEATFLQEEQLNNYAIGLHLTWKRCSLQIMTALMQATLYMDSFEKLEKILESSQKITNEFSKKSSKWDLRSPNHQKISTLLVGINTCLQEIEASNLAYIQSSQFRKVCVTISASVKRTSDFLDGNTIELPSEMSDWI